MSLNGDVVVMRNGRSTSQISVYNYPEHLNPFYEDDQHKRLRFWHINKKNDGEGRRNSFSIGGLKDMWAFKSFRLKKKSSTLGVNKTSESPPQLRRDVQYGFHTYDDRLSRCVSNGTPTNGGNAFQRNIPYRSSLQNVNSSGKEKSSSGLGFNRNDQYRSTTQFGGVVQRRQQQQTHTLPPPRRYVYGGSVTPQPLRSSEFGRGISGAAGPDALTRGSSQISVLTTSTNPFDTDNEEDEDTLSISGSPTSPTKRTPRKKRRAPAPPVPDHKVNNETRTHLSKETSQPIPQQLQELHIEEDLNIANLTAQIESLAHKDDDSLDKKKTAVTNSKEAQHEIAPTKSNGAIPKETIQPPTYLTATSKETSETPESSHQPELRVREETTFSPAQKLLNKPVESNTESEVGHVECIHIHVESPRATPERQVPSRVTSFQQEHKNEAKPVTGTTSFTLSSPPASRKTSADNNSIKKEIVVVTTTNTVHRTSREVPKTEELKITEEPKEENVVVSDTVDESTKPAIKPPIATKPNLEGKTRVSFVAEVHKPTTVIENSKVSNGTVPKTPEVARRTKIFGNSVNNELKPVNVEPESIRIVETIIATPKSKEISPANQTSTAPKLEIVESKENHLEQTTSSREGTTTTQLIAPPMRPMRSRDEFEALYRPKPSSHLEWKQSTLAPLEAKVPPEKRKSVKDIIESINRSQRLLKSAANKEAPQTAFSDSEQDVPPVAATRTHLTPIMQRKFSEPNNDFNQRQNDDIVGVIETTQTNGNATAELENLEPSGGIMHHNNNNDPNKLNNADIFKKCVVTKEVYHHRESSPTASNLDWNPVPKPKRTKNLAEL